MITMLYVLTLRNRIDLLPAIDRIQKYYFICSHIDLRKSYLGQWPLEEPVLWLNSSLTSAHKDAFSSVNLLYPHTRIVKPSYQDDLIK